MAHGPRRMVGAGDVALEPAAFRNEQPVRRRVTRPPRKTMKLRWREVARTRGGHSSAGAHVSFEERLEKIELDKVALSTTKKVLMGPMDENATRFRSYSADHTCVYLDSPRLVH